MENSVDPDQLTSDILYSLWKTVWIQISWLLMRVLLFLKYIFSVENSVDPDQLASGVCVTFLNSLFSVKNVWIKISWLLKPADLDPHCFSSAL